MRTPPRMAITIASRTILLLEQAGQGVDPLGKRRSAGWAVNA